MEVQGQAHSLARNFLSIIQIFNKCPKITVEVGVLLNAIIAKKWDICPKIALSKRDKVLMVEEVSRKIPLNLEEKLIMMDGTKIKKNLNGTAMLGGLKTKSKEKILQHRPGEGMTQMVLGQEMFNLTINLAKALITFNQQDGVRKLPQTEMTLVEEKNGAMME